MDKSCQDYNIRMTELSIKTQNLKMFSKCRKKTAEEKARKFKSHPVAKIKCFLIQQILLTVFKVHIV